MSITKFNVSGMTCGGCVNRVKAVLSQYAENVEVTLEPAEAVLTNATVELDTLNNALIHVGHYKLTSTKSNQDTNKNISEIKKWLATYKPLLLVFGYIFLVTFTVEVSNGEFILHRWMPNFMAGFFIVFSFFKLLDLKGFANSYAMYDILAKRSNIYAYLYPFIELGLGTMYLLGWQSVLTNALTLGLMTFSSIGVILAVLNKQKIRCACLGTGFNLPMTTVTIIEDLLMAAMAAWMLL
jgi:copper chaperone CopZ